MSKTPQQLIEEFATISITPETSAKRYGIVDQLASMDIHMDTGNRWIDYTTGADLGPVSPEGSVRAISKLARRG